MKALLIAVLLLWPASKHPFHSALAEVIYNEGDKRLEVSLRMFTDDLEDALAKHSGLGFVELSKAELTMPIVKSYVFSNFEIEGLEGYTAFLGYEAEGDATWVHFAYEQCGTCQPGILTFNIMLDQFSDQTNLANITYGTQRKSFIFTSSARRQEFKFWGGGNSHFKTLY